MQKTVVSLLAIAAAFGIAACSPVERNVYDLVPGSGVEIVNAKTHIEGTTTFAYRESEGYFDVYLDGERGTAEIYVTVNGVPFGRLSRYPEGYKFPYLDCSDAKLVLNGKAIRPSTPSCSGESNQEQMTDSGTVKVSFKVGEPFSGPVLVTLPQVKRLEDSKRPAKTVEYRQKKFREGGGWH